MNRGKQYLFGRRKENPAITLASIILKIRVGKNVLDILLSAKNVLIKIREQNNT